MRLLTSLVERAVRVLPYELHQKFRLARNVHVVCHLPGTPVQCITISYTKARDYTICTDIMSPLSEISC